uniref:Uncharacterized protein n=1 Tax=Anguilla anguilla TaxID=7936 RepID=A0A0E9SSQ9_ANGAN
MSNVQPLCKSKQNKTVLSYVACGYN